MLTNHTVRKQLSTHAENEHSTATFLNARTRKLNQRNQGRIKKHTKQDMCSGRNEGNCRCAHNLSVQRCVTQTMRKASAVRDVKAQRLLGFTFRGSKCDLFTFHLSFSTLFRRHACPDFYAQIKPQNTRTYCGFGTV